VPYYDCRNFRFEQACYVVNLLAAAKPERSNRFARSLDTWNYRNSKFEELQLQTVISTSACSVLPSSSFDYAQYVRNKTIYIALGILPDGKKEIPGIWIEQTEGAKFWLRVVNEQKSRIVQDILIAVVDVTCP